MSDKDKKVSILPGDILYFQYKDGKNKIQQQLIFLLDYHPNAMLFVGIDLYFLFFIDQEYPAYLHNTLHNALHQEKNRIDAAHFQKFFEEAFLQHPISKSNEVQDKARKNQDLKFMQAVYKSIRNFKISDKHIQSNIVVEKIDLTQAIEKLGDKK